MVELGSKELLVAQMLENRNVMRNNQEWEISPSISSAGDGKKMGRKSIGSPGCRRS